VIRCAAGSRKVFSIRIYLLTHAILFLAFFHGLRLRAGSAADDRAAAVQGFTAAC